ncbi:hypothetical protein PFISCL1PPCAC_6452, partial [Pristionchus fissidentatus]
WTCPTGPALADAPHLTFVDLFPASSLKYEEIVRYRCKNQSVNPSTWEASCTDRGAIGPAASIFNGDCEPEDEPVDMEESIEEQSDISCDKCMKAGTDHCEEDGNGTAICVCKTGWKGLTCWVTPKFCP